MVTSIAAEEAPATDSSPSALLHSRLLAKALLETPRHQFTPGSRRAALSQRATSRSCSAARTRARAARRPRSSTRSTNAPRSSSGSGSRWRTRHTVSTNAALRAHPLRLEPAGDVGEPGALAAAPRSPRRPRSSTAAASRRSTARTAPPPRDLVRGGAERVDVPAAAALRDQRGRRASSPGAARRTARRGRGSSETWRWRRRRRPARAASSSTRSWQRIVARSPSARARVLDHRRRDVDAVHAPARHPVGEHRRDPPEPQPASSTTSSPRSGSRSSCSSAQPSWTSRRRGRRSPRPSRATGAHSAVVTGPGRSRSRSYATIASLLRERQRDVVEPVQQPVLDLGVDLEPRAPARPPNLLGGEVDLRLPRLGDRRAIVRGQLHRQQPDLRAVGAEDVGEARRDDRLEAVVLERPRGVLAARAAAEVAARRRGSGSAAAPSRAPSPSRRTGTRRTRSARPA